MASRSTARTYSTPTTMSFTERVKLVKAKLRLDGSEVLQVVEAAEQQLELCPGRTLPGASRRDLEHVGHR